MAMFLVRRLLGLVPGHRPDLGFPGAAQVFLIERYTTRTVRKPTKGSRGYRKVQIRTAVAVLGITSLSAREAAPQHLAGYVRGHWSIETRSTDMLTALPARLAAV
jgi:hypothetical protein